MPLIAALTAAAAVVEVNPLSASFSRSKSTSYSGVYWSRLRTAWTKIGFSIIFARMRRASFSVLSKS